MKTRLMILGLSLGSAFSIAAFAAVPNTFQSGSPAKAAEVNANFSNVDGRITTLDGRVSSLETKDTSQDSTIAKNQTDQSKAIQQLDGQVTTLEDQVTALTAPSPEPANGFEFLAYGTFEIPSATVGEVVDCSAKPDPTLLRFRLTFFSAAGICDDFTTDKPCGARITLVQERCLDDQIGITISGVLRGLHYTDSRFRICFDTSAQGVCDPGTEVAAGFITTQHRFDKGTGTKLATPMDRAVSTVHIETVKPFSIDGRDVQFRVGLSHTSEESESSGQGCAISAKKCSVVRAGTQ